jgi:predicted nucleic acid-binding protein
MRSFFARCYENDIELITSTLTIEEYSVFPYRINNVELIRNFFKFMEELDIEIVDIDCDIADQAAKIRAEYKDFKGMDSLQIAAAIVCDCDSFLTNDKQLRQEKEIICITLDEI